MLLLFVPLPRSRTAVVPAPVTPTDWPPLLRHLPPQRDHECWSYSSLPPVSVTCLSSLWSRSWLMSEFLPTKAVDDARNTISPIPSSQTQPLWNLECVSVSIGVQIISTLFLDFHNLHRDGG